MEAERWRQIEEFYYQALDCAPGDRAAFLAQACAGDPLLKEEIVSLLASHEAAADRFLQSPALRIAAPFTATEMAPTAGLLDGEPLTNASRQFIGQYQLLREIGRGGMGAVYLAERADDQYRKQVAIKLIRGGIDHDDLIRRFRNERQVLAELDHPHIARFLEGGATADGKPYFIMEHIDGRPINDDCDARRLSINDRLRLFRDVCNAVQYAHQRLVIHRDIKPTNILVTEGGIVKLLDFGVAKLLDPELMDQTLETAAEVRLMTPEYASPEQIRGERVTTATDVYSLGVVLYELLCGHRPYQFERRSWEEIERVVCQQEPMRPSAALTAVTARHADQTTQVIEPETLSNARGETIRSLRQRLAKDLDKIVMMALRKEPERRYVSVEQLSEDLRRYLEGMPVLARPNTLGYRTGKFIRRNKVAVTAIALILLTLLGGIGATLREAHIARDALIKAEISLAQAEAERRRAEGALEVAETERARAVAEESKAEAQRKQALEAQAFAEIQRMAAENERAKAETERARAERRFNDVRKLSNTLMWSVHDRIKNLPGATPARELIVTTALEYLDSLAKEAGNDLRLQRELATAYEKVGDVQGSPGSSSLGKMADALESQNKALAIRQALVTAKPEDPDYRADLAISHNRVGELLKATGDKAAAAEHLRREIALSEALLAASPTDKHRRWVAASYDRLANDLVEKGDYAKALTVRRKMQKIYEELFAANPTNAHDQRNLALNYKRLGALLTRDEIGTKADALEYYRKALELDQALAAANPNNVETQLDLSYSYGEIGYVKWKTEDLAGGLEYYQKALAIREAMVKADPRNERARRARTSGLIRVGWILTDLGDVNGALEHFRQAHEEVSETAVAPKGSGGVSTALASYDLASYYTSLGLDQKKPAARRIGYWQSARSWYQRCLDEWLALRKAGGLSEANLKKPEEVQREISKCDAALTELKTR